MTPWIGRLSPKTRLVLRRASRASVRRILSRYLGCPVEDVLLDRASSTRPELRGAGSLAFSVAHSGCLMLLAIGHTARLGVDIEQVRDGVRVDRVIHRFFSDREVEGLRSLAEEKWGGAFFHAWVCKEAYLKAVGGSVPAGLRQFTISMSPDEPPAVLETRLEPGEASNVSLYSVDVPTGYMGAVAIEGTGHRIRCFDTAEQASTGMNLTEHLRRAGNPSSRYHWHR